MNWRRGYRVPGTRLFARLSSPSGAPPDNLTDRLGLAALSPAETDACPSGCDIEWHPGLAAELASDLAQLAPQDALQCGDAVYLRDSRLQLGAQLRLESCNEAVLPAVGLEVALTVCLARQGALTLHACGFRYGGLDCLALGPSGAGKSTLTAAVLAAGGQVLSDDQLLCHQHGPTLQARWLRRDLSLRRGALAVLPTTLHERLTHHSVGGEDRWTLARRHLQAQALDTLSPQLLLYLATADDSGHRPSGMPQVRAISHGLALAQLIKASSPLLFGRDTPGTATLMAGARQLLTTTRQFQVSLPTVLLRHPERALDRLLAACHEGLPG